MEISLKRDNTEVYSTPNYYIFPKVTLSPKKDSWIDEERGYVSRDEVEKANPGLNQLFKEINDLSNTTRTSRRNEMSKYTIPVSSDEDFRIGSEAGIFNGAIFHPHIVREAIKAAKEAGLPINKAIGMLFRESLGGNSKGAFRTDDNGNAYLSGLISNWRQYFTIHNANSKHDRYSRIYDQWRRGETLSADDRSFLNVYRNKWQRERDSILPITENPLVNGYRAYAENPHVWDMGNDNSYHSRIVNDFNMLLKDSKVKNWFLKEGVQIEQDGGSLGDYIRHKTDSVRNQALINFSHLKEALIPKIPNPSPKEEWESDAKGAYRYWAREYLRTLNKKKQKLNNQERKINKFELDQAKHYLNLAEQEYEQGYPKYIGGATCLYTASGCYPHKVSGNETFMNNPSKYGFKEISEQERLPGDLVQHIINETHPIHALLYFEDDKFNYSNGTSGRNSLVREGKYPIKEGESFKYYRFVGTDDDRKKWEQEYKLSPHKKGGL